MSSPHEFMERYFRVRTELFRQEIEQRLPYRDSFFTADCVYDRRDRHIEQSEAEKIISISELENGMEVITTGLIVSDKQIRMRYTLKSLAQSWRIDRVQWECDFCNGTGSRKGKGCILCKGNGWWGA